MTRWILLFAAGCGAAESPLDPALRARYDAHCAACHEAGAADAPRRGDEADWSRRRRRGLAGMMETVRKGNVAMPPRGRCYDCADAELEALATWLSGS